MSNINRRSFLTLAGAGVLALNTPSFAKPSKKSKLPEIGVQLYSVRKNIEKAFDETINKIAAIGFHGVETYALPAEISLRHAANTFKRNKLKVLAMHTDLPVGDQRSKALEMADAYSCDRVIYAGWPQGEKYKDQDAMKKTVELYNEVGSFLKGKGLKFGLHNHWWEFEMVDGVYPFYYLLEHLDMDIFFEIDTYWAKTAGMTPSKAVRDFGKRAPLLHIKDGPALKGDHMYEQAPAGKGTQDFLAIAEAGRSNTQWMIIEFDEYAGDIFEGLKSSYSYLKTNHLVNA